MGELRLLDSKKSYQRLRSAAAARRSGRRRLQRMFDRAYGRTEKVNPRGSASFLTGCGRNSQAGSGSTGRPGVEKMISVIALMLRLP